MTEIKNVMGIADSETDKVGIVHFISSGSFLIDLYIVRKFRTRPFCNFLRQIIFKNYARRFSDGFVRRALPEQKFEKILAC
jgi:hypothetical protein